MSSYIKSVITHYYISSQDTIKESVAEMGEKNIPILVESAEMPSYLEFSDGGRQFLLAVGNHHQGLLKNVLLLLDIIVVLACEKSQFVNTAHVRLRGTYHLHNGK